MMRMREESCRYLVVLYSSKIFSQPECLHGAIVLGVMPFRGSIHS